MSNSSSCCSACRRYLCIDDRIDYSFSHNCLVSISCSSCSCIVLVNGIPKTTKSNWSIATSARISKSTIHQSRCNVRTITRLSIIKITNKSYSVSTKKKRRAIEKQKKIVTTNRVKQKLGKKYLNNYKKNV